MDQDYDSADLKELNSGKKSSSLSVSSSDERSLRFKQYKVQPKIDKVTWDRFNFTFWTFCHAIEGHLYQAGAGYLVDQHFIHTYQKLGEQYIKSDIFWKLYKISLPQALYDTEYLYGMLVTATMKSQQATIIHYHTTREGILAWRDLKENYAYDGSPELCTEILESKAHTPYDLKSTGGIAGYIDDFQACIAELEAIAKIPWENTQKKGLLIVNLKDAPGINYLLQQVRDNTEWTFKKASAYL
jgi:hypothetical protein